MREKARSLLWSATGYIGSVKRDVMRNFRVVVGGMLFASLFLLWSQEQPRPAQPPRDAVQEAQRSLTSAPKRPEQSKSPHDQSDRFSAANADPSSPVFKSQPKEGKISGFDFYRDPLNADRPFMTPDEVMKKEIATKPSVMENQRKLLESRYNLTPKLDPNAKMSRGKPLPIGPTARLGTGMTWEKLGAMTPAAIGQQNLFPYPSLPHPLQANGGQVFPAMQIEMFPRLERF